MSRIGKLPIELPENVTFEISKDNVIKVKGPLGELSQKVDPSITVSKEENKVIVKRANDEKQVRSFHGLYRSLINNMIIGVTKGYEIKQEFVGVGYKAEMKGQIIELNLGYTHPIYIDLAPEIKASVEVVKRGNPILTLKSHDKQLIGQVAAKIRSFRPPEPYKGKGIKFVGEELRRKAGKTASA